MEIDLNKISKENRDTLLKIINEENIGMSPSKSELTNIRGMETYDKIFSNEPQNVELDTGLNFEHAMSEVKHTRKRNTSADKETYRTLTLIHSKGVDNFWREVKQVVESKINVNINDCSDKISSKDIWG